MIKYLVLLLILCNGFVFSSVDLDPCKGGKDRDGVVFAYHRDIENPQDYTLQLGFGHNVSVTPKKFFIEYSDSVCSPSNLFGYTFKDYDDTVSKNRTVLKTDAEFVPGAAHIRQSDISAGSSMVFNSFTYIYNSIKGSTDYVLDDSVASGDPFNGNAIHLMSDVKTELRVGSRSNPCAYELIGNTLDIREDGTDKGCLMTVIVTDSDAKKHEFSFRGKVDSCKFTDPSSDCLTKAVLKDENNATTNIYVKTNGMYTYFYNADTDEKL